MTENVGDPAGSARTSGRRLRPEDRRRQIVAAAMVCFARKGYHATTPHDIAFEAGVTRPLLYRFFADKDELYLKVLRDARGRLDEALFSAVDPAAEPAEQLRQGALALFEFVRDDPLTSDLLYSTGIAIADPVAAEVIDLRFATIAKISDLVATAARSLERPVVDAYAHIVYGAAEQLVRWARQTGAIDPPALTARLIEGVWFGLERYADPGPDDARPGADGPGT